MKCNAVRAQLSDYVSGDLSAAAKARLEAHLEACGGDCRQHLAELQQTVRLVSQLGQLKCPVDCRAAVLARLETPVPEPAPARFRFHLPRLGLGGALGAGLA